MFKPGTKTTVGLFLGVAGVALTSGCSNGGDVFSKAQSGTDELPAGGTSGVIDSITADTTRFLWESEGVAFYAAKSRENKDAQCLITARSLDLVSYCSTQLPLAVTDSSGGYAFGPVAPTASGWERLSESFWRLNK